MWKLINWSIVLSKIVYNLHKMGRYFGDDFKGVWIICCYIISQDESVLMLFISYSMTFRNKKLKQNHKNGWKSLILAIRKCKWIGGLTHSMFSLFSLRNS